MCCFTKGAVRIGLMAALAGGAAAIVAESVRPGSVGAILHQATGVVGGVIDSNIDDPAAMRAQISKLQAEYPEKIADVRADLGEVREQISQLERERAVSEKVVELTASDLHLLESGIEQARAAQVSHHGAVVRIAFNETRLSPTDAMSKRSQIAETRAVYQTRVGEIGTELGFLLDQEAQLDDLLTRLETEQSEFQAQLFQLDAQIDSIARNDRLIEMMEERQATIDEHSRYEAHSLTQIRGRLDRVRAEQQARIASITRQEKARDYVAEAEYLTDQTGASSVLIEPGGPVQDKIIWDETEVIEIDPRADEDQEQIVQND